MNGPRCYYVNGNKLAERNTHMVYLHVQSKIKTIIIKKNKQNHKEQNVITIVDEGQRLHNR